MGLILHSIKLYPHPPTSTQQDLRSRVMITGDECTVGVQASYRKKITKPDQFTNNSRNVFNHIDIYAIRKMDPIY